MNLKKMTRDELEKLSHLDIAYHIIKNSKKKYGTIDLLKKVCELLEYEENEVENLIGDFYTSLNLDKRFLLIDGKWDLTENHSVKMIVDDEGDDDIESYDDIDESDEEATEIEDEAVLDEAEALEDVEDDLDDDMDDLTILTEEEMDEEEIL